MKPDVRICADVNELSRRAAETAVGAIDDAVRGRGRCSLVLSGGSTPRTLYALFATEFRDRIPWTHVHVFWGDERYVLPHDPDSYFRHRDLAATDMLGDFERARIIITKKSRLPLAQ